MYAQIATNRNDFVAPRRISRKNHIPSQAAPTLPLDAQAAMQLAQHGAFVLENHEVDPGKAPSQVFFFTANVTVTKRSDGSKLYKVDQ